MATPPFGGPDEAAHYLRALTISRGALLGPRARFVNPANTPAQLSWANYHTRRLFVPPALAPPNVFCLDGKPDLAPPGCEEATYTGDYQPLPYLLPALLEGTAHTADTAMWLSRLGSALPCLALLALALWLAAGAGAWAVIGLVLSLSPMVLFVGSLLNPNGLEIAASAAFLSALLSTVAGPRPVPRGHWFAIAGTGAVTVLAWQLGPLFAAVDLVIAAAMLARDEPRAWLRSHRLAIVATLGSLLVALALYLLYGLSSGASHATIGFGPQVGASLGSGFKQLAPVLRDAVGTFGQLTVPLPRVMRWAWWLAVVGLCLYALRRGSTASRARIVAVAVLAPVVIALFYAAAYRHTGFGMQGRYVLPLLMAIPTLAGFELARARPLPPASQEVPIALVVAAAGAFQLAAWWLNARFSALRPHALWFISGALWKPPLGWLPWLALAILGAALLGMAALFMLTASLDDRRAVLGRGQSA